MNRKEWYDKAMQGTDGSMVFDILKDWKAEQEYTISRIADLEKQLQFLECLEMAGVDNWEGVSYAHELMEEYYE